MSIREINILDNPAIEYYYMQREKKNGSVLCCRNHRTLEPQNSGRKNKQKENPKEMKITVRNDFG